jgi:hypothetical protein
MLVHAGLSSLTSLHRIELKRVDGASGLEEEFVSSMLETIRR